MNAFVKTKQSILLAGDILLLYLSLFLTLYFRYRDSFDTRILSDHAEIFTYTFLLWLLTFYIVGLYDIQHQKNNYDFLKKLSSVFIVNAGLAIAIFYFIPSTLAPKTNLFITLLISSFLLYLWRRFYNRFIATTASTNTLIIGSSEATKEIVKKVNDNPQLGYTIKFWIKEGFSDKEITHLNQIIIAENINLIVIPPIFKKIPKAAHAIYENLSLGIEISDTTSFYSTIFNKIPLSEIEEIWFVENIFRHHRLYELFKRPLEIVIACLLAIITLPLSLLVVILTTLFSPGPILYSQNRIGQFNKSFTLYKFRTMVKDAEKKGAQWSQPGDRRVTPLGRILRHSHLDELPQLINIIQGNLSFVGPRPERPEFTEKLKTVIPHYELRHIIRPGITGWAQLNYRYGSSTEDTYEKLQYDLFYLKNRSFWLDLGIVLKTIKLFFISNG